MTDPAGGPGSGWLPDAYLEEIFQGPIVEDLHADARPVTAGRQPELIVLVGQPGAANAAAHMTFVQYHVHRSGVAHEAEYGGDGMVSVELDHFRHYHPQYSHLARTAPQDVEAVTEEAALWWQNRATEHLMARRFNVLLEREWDSADGVILNAERFADAGYKVHVSGLAVPATMSRLAIIESFSHQALLSGTGRWVSSERHDAGYKLTSEVLARAEDCEAVAKITVQSRDGMVHDKQRGPNGQWPQRAVPAPAVLDEVRAQVMPRTQRIALLNRLTANMERLALLAVAHTAAYDLAADVAQELTGGPQPETAGDLYRSLGDLAAANEALGLVTDPEGLDSPDLGLDPGIDLDPGPGLDAGPEPPPPPAPEPPGPEM